MARWLVFMVRVVRSMVRVVGRGDMVDRVVKRSGMVVRVVRSIVRVVGRSVSGGVVRVVTRSGKVVSFSWSGWCRGVTWWLVFHDRVVRSIVRVVSRGQGGGAFSEKHGQGGDAEWQGG